MRKNLSGKWSFRKATGTDVAALAQEREGWLKADVPGCVHLDLMEAGRIPDPFYGLNELEVQWVEREDWLYRRRFRCDDALLRQDRIELVCEGLDTFATVYLNGTQIGRADNMFRRWRWDVKQLLKEGENELLILFHSSSRICEELERENGKLPVALEYSPRVYARMVGYATEWDWAPRLITCGVWRPIYLEAYTGGRIADVFTPVDWTDTDKPLLRLTVEVEALEAGTATLTAELRRDGTSQTVELASDVKAGTNVLKAEIVIEKPALWWPAGYGEQNLYELLVSGTVNGHPLQETKTTIGLRRVELRREKDEQGESFIFYINGEPIFCKGANWAPADSFLPRLTPQRYEELVRKAVEANMNMFRVNGVGIYEANEFYDACDRLGVMVWQDFTFTCACYPDHLDWFCQSVRSEAEDNVRRLRNHPSLVLWCGNNENHWGFQSWWKGLDRFPGEKIYHQILPEVVERLDGTRPYWPGSPYGGEDPNGTSHGDQHSWHVWFGWADPEEYRAHDGRFVSEFGLQAPPALETIRAYIPSSARHLQSRVMEHHNKETEGTQRCYRYLAAFFRIPAGFEDTVYLMQLAQGEALKIGAEHWRLRKFATAGALFWQLNDCWPVSSWSCLDWCMRPKALYYYARRFFAPVLAAIEPRGDKVHIGVVNDLTEEFSGKLVYGLGRVDGQDVWVEEKEINVPPNAVLDGVVKDKSELGLSDPTIEYLWCRLLDNNQEVSRNTHFFKRFKHVALPREGFEVEVAKTGGRLFALQLQCPVFAKGVWLRAEGLEAQFEDNYFDLLPHVPVRLKVTTPVDMEADELKRRLLIRTAADAQG